MAPRGRTRVIVPILRDRIDMIVALGGRRRMVVPMSRRRRLRRLIIMMPRILCTQRGRRSHDPRTAKHDRHGERGRSQR
jgi:hypothetical protein